METIAILGTGDAPVPNAQVPQAIADAASGFVPRLCDVSGAVFPDTPSARALCEQAYTDAAIAAEAEGHAGTYINTVGDYGLASARASCSIPVTGAGEGAIRTAQNIADRFSIVTIWPPALRFIYDAILSATGTEDKCLSIHHLSEDADLATLGQPDNFVADMQACGFTTMSQIRRACDHALTSEGADVIILGCTCMHPVAPLLEDDGIAVIEPMVTGYRYLESLIKADA